SIVVETWIASGPIDEIELRIVSARHPRRAPSMLDLFSLPGFRTRLARVRNGPDAPDFLARLCIVCSNESANALIAACGTGDHEIADGKRRRSAVVVLMPVCHLGFPEKLSMTTIECNHVGVVGQHEEAIAGNRDTAVETDRRITGQPA